jgi:uncharacterized membrane protein
MKECITLLPEVMVLLTVASIFVILFVTVLKILKAVSFFQGKTTVVMTLSICVLCIIGLSLAVPTATHNTAAGSRNVDGTLCYLLLPYVAMAVAAAVILSQVLLLASRVSPGERGGSSAEKSENMAATTKPRGRPKKKEAAEAQSKAAARTSRSGSVSNNRASDTADGL